MIELVNNRNITARSILAEYLRWCNEFDFASAYLTDSGFYILSDEILEFVNRGGKIRLIVDIESGYTDYNSILEFATLVGDCHCKIFISKRGNFHPKLYLFRKDEESRALIGSSNFTSSGLQLNTEANLALNESSANRSAINKLQKYFEELWLCPNALPVEENDELLEKYRIVTSQNRRKTKLKANEIVQIPEIERVKTDLPVIKELIDLYKNPSIAYTLGLICGKGQIDYTSRTMEFNLKNWLNEERVIEGYYVKIDAIEAHDYAANGIVDVFYSCSELFDEILEIDITPKITKRQISTKIEIVFPERSRFISFVFKSLRGKAQNNEYSIPDFICKGTNAVKRSFLRGYSDVASLLSKGTQTFGSGRFRIYVNVYGRNETLFKQLIVMFSEVGVKCNAHDRRKTAKYDKREMQIRVYPERFQGVGFNVAWKKRLLYDFIRANYVLNQKQNSTGILL